MYSEYIELKQCFSFVIQGGYIMAFCSMCGAELGSGVRFCSKCGAAVNGVPNNMAVAVVGSGSQVSSLAQAEKTRSETLAEMNKMIMYFGVKQNQYDEYDECVRNLNYLSRPGVSVRYNNGKLAGQLIGIGIITICFGGFLGLLTFSFGKVGLVLGLIILASAITGGVILIVKGNENRSFNAIQMQREKERLIGYYSNRFSELAQELLTYYKNYGYCATGPSYTNPKILSRLRDLIVSGRAETIKESINLMHQEAHNSEMELNAANAASGAMAAAFFTAASFLLK